MGTLAADCMGVAESGTTASSLDSGLVGRYRSSLSTTSCTSPPPLSTPLVPLCLLHLLSLFFPPPHICCLPSLFQAPPLLPLSLYHPSFSFHLSDLPVVLPSDHSPSLTTNTSPFCPPPSAFPQISSHSPPFHSFIVPHCSPPTLILPYCDRGVGGRGGEGAREKGI